jgi:hypothetical protein
MKKKNIILFILFIMVVCLFAGISCASWGADKNLKISIHLDRKNLARSSILVFSFKEPGYAEGMGVQVAELFQSSLLKSKKFKVTALYGDSTWGRIHELEEKRLLYAMEAGQSQKYDYILVGELREFFQGGISPTRVSFKIRVIEVETRATIILAEYDKQSNAKDPTFPMDGQLSQKAIHPRQLAESMVNEMVKKLFL